MRSKLPYVNGAANAIAQGQAIISTDVNTFIAFVVSIKSQKLVAKKAMLKMAIVNPLLNVLVSVVNLSSLFLSKIGLLHN